MNVSLKVKIFDDKGTRVLQVSKSTLTIGSASHCDVVFDHPSVNPEHTRAWLEGGRIWVQDLGSPSGTALNEIRLPALKPMLVRELDVLRLGESPSTLGLEAIVVRAPVVKPKVAEAPASSGASMADAKGLSGPELEKRKEEAAKLARELADLRLHVQMARLEKTASEEMTNQLENLKDEIKTVHDQKEKWDASLQQMEEEKQKIRGEVEREIAEWKAKAIAELKKTSVSEAHERVRELETEARVAKEKHDSQLQKLREESESTVQKLKAANEAAMTKTREQHDALMATIREQTESQLSTQARHSRDETDKEIRQLRDQLETQRKGFEKELAEFKTKAIKEVQRATTEEAGQQIKPLHEELKKFQVANKKLEKDLVDAKSRLQSEATEHESARKDLEKQISEVRAKSFKELSAHMLTEAQKHEKWKQEQTSAFEKAVHSLARQKMRIWTAQGLDQEFVHEWEADITHAFRKLILNENEPQPTKRAPAAVQPDVDEVPAPVPHKEKKRSASSRRSLKRWRPFAFPAFFAVLIGAALWFIAPFFRQYASRTMSSQAPMPVAPQARAAVIAAPGPFQPKQSKRYRNTYTENVIFLENYVGAEQNVDFRRRWQSELNKIATSEWKLDSWTIAPVAVEEQNLIKDLSKIRDSIHTTDLEAAGVERMRAREKKYLHDLEAIFKSRAGVERFLKFKRAFYLRNQAYLTQAN